MDILFIGIPDYEDAFEEEWNSNFRYAISFLRKNSINAGLFCPSVPVDFKKRLSKISGMRPSILFFNLNEENFKAGIRYIQRIRRASKRSKIVLGGLRATLLANEIMAEHSEVDYVVKGESEITLLELARKIKTGGRIDNVAGLSGRDFDNSPRPLIEDLDVLENMALDGLDEMLFGKKGGERAAHIVTSRGCYGQCSFCQVPPLYKASPGRIWRGRSPKNVVDEIEDLAKRLKISYFVFADDNYMGPGRAGRNRARRIAEEILRRKLNIRYAVSSRINDINAETLRIMKRSGLDRLGVSVESANQRALDLFNKQIRVKGIFDALNLLEKMRIKTQVNMIFFDPYTAINEIRKNLAFLKYIKGSKYLTYARSFPFNELIPFPGAPITEVLKKDDLLKKENYSCKYRDPKVGQVVKLIDYFRRHPALNFKSRLLFNRLNARSALNQNPKAFQSILAFSLGVRRWLGLELLPELIAEACDILQRPAAAHRKGLEKLEKRFENEADKISRIAKEI